MLACQWSAPLSIGGSTRKGSCSCHTAIRFEKTGTETETEAEAETDKGASTDTDTGTDGHRHGHGEGNGDVRNFPWVDVEDREYTYASGQNLTCLWHLVRLIPSKSFIPTMIRRQHQVKV